MGGSRCCILGCGANSVRHKGLTFHNIPAKGKTSDGDMWRSKLLLATCRHDSGFKPDTAKICSRHFEADCFESSTGLLRRLRLFSMPTKFMPQEYPSNCAKTTPGATLCEPPVLSEVAFYCNMDYLQTDALKLLTSIPAWSLQIHSGGVRFTLIYDERVTLSLLISNELKSTIAIRGILHAFPENAVEKEGLKQVLTDLEKIRICPGITCEESQNYAQIRITGKCNTGKYYRQVFSGKVNSTSAVYSDNCLLACQADGPCKRCSELQELLIRKHERATSDTPISKYANLSKLQPNVLISLLKASRKETNDLQAKLKKILAV